MEISNTTSIPYDTIRTAQAKEISTSKETEDKKETAIATDTTNQAATKQDRISLSSEAQAMLSAPSPSPASIPSSSPSVTSSSDTDDSTDLSTLSEYEIQKLVLDGSITASEAQAELASREGAQVSSPDSTAQTYAAASAGNLLNVAI